MVWSIIIQRHCITLIDKCSKFCDLILGDPFHFVIDWTGDSIWMLLAGAEF